MAREAGDGSATAAGCGSNPNREPRADAGLRGPATQEGRPTGVARARRSPAVHLRGVHGWARPGRDRGQGPGEAPGPRAPDTGEQHHRDRPTLRQEAWPPVHPAKPKISSHYENPQGITKTRLSYLL